MITAHFAHGANEAEEALLFPFCCFLAASVAWRFGRVPRVNLWPGSEAELAQSVMQVRESCGRQGTAARPNSAARRRAPTVQDQGKITHKRNGSIGGED
jgi:hypothetical protein